MTKKFTDYHIVIAPNGEGYYADVPALPSCYAVGDTPEEALAELEGVFGMVVEEFEERGEPLPQDVTELVPVAS